MQHPVCIVLASRSPANNLKVPAKVRFRSLAPGRREEKFAELAGISLGGDGWKDGAVGWRAPFLPEFSGGWADFAPIESVLDDCGLGVMPGRTWIIAPDTDALKSRWNKLISEPDAARRAQLFHPHLRKGLPGDKHIAKSVSALPGRSHSTRSVADLIEEVQDEKTRPKALEALKIAPPVKYGFRSFDRQWIIPDARLINQPAPKLWASYGPEQIFVTALSRSSPDAGPAISLTSNLPDHDHFKGSFSGRVFALWKDAAATLTNVSADTIAALARAYGAAPDPVDIFAYVAALLAHPAYTERFKPDLIRPGLRVPLTADKALFTEAAKLGREIIWLHSFGERMNEGRPAGEPRLPDGERPDYSKAGKIPDTPEGFPDSIDYDPALKRLKIGAGFIDNVPPAVWAYEVSGKQVLRQWFSYRKRNRDRPQIGDRRPPSRLGEIQPKHWLPEYTEELLNVLNVLGLLVELEPKQADLLKRICDGPLIPASKLVAG